MMYNHQYQYWSEQDPNEEPEVKSARHECVGDAVFAIMEQLYDSGNAIDKESLRQHFSYLCDELNISKGLLKDPDGLCVIHHKEKQPDTANEVRSSLRRHTKALKEELCSEHRPVDINRLSDAVKSICWESGDMMSRGEEIKVCRSNGWRHHQ